MANSTDTYWSINGVSLQTLGFNITTKGGHEPPPLRGEDDLIPYKVGRVLNERIPDSRTLPFSMWAIGMTEDGAVGPYGPRAEYERNYKKLRALIFNQGRPFQLTKRWKDYGSTTVKSATAIGVYEGGLPETMTGPARATFGFDVWLADPFFYGEEESIPFSATQPSVQTPTILGDYETTLITLQINGARTNTRLTNNTEGHYVNIASTIAAGQSAILNVDEWTANRSIVNLIKDVTHFGNKHWLSLRPGTQQLTLSSTNGSGSAILKYIPRYL
ncbi:minor tail protein [Microbacterium phage Magritte]|nr:minor tail protein [Microbacterium phage Magritte]